MKIRLSWSTYLLVLQVLVEGKSFGVVTARLEEQDLLVWIRVDFVLDAGESADYTVRVFEFYVQLLNQVVILDA